MSPAGAGGVDREAIRARADAATPGRWFRQYGDVVLSSDDPRDVAEGYDEPRAERVVRSAPHRGLRDPQAIADAEFIAHARDDVPALLAALAAAEQRADTAEAKLSEPCVVCTRPYVEHSPISSRCRGFIADPLMLKWIRDTEARRIEAEQKRIAAEQRADTLRELLDRVALDHDEAEQRAATAAADERARIADEIEAARTCSACADFYSGKATPLHDLELGCAPECPCSHEHARWVGYSDGALTRIAAEVRAALSSRPVPPDMDGNRISIPEPVQPEEAAQCMCRGGPHGGYTCPNCSGGPR